MKKILLGVFLFLISFSWVSTTANVIIDKDLNEEKSISTNTNTVYPWEKCFWKIFNNSNKIFIGSLESSTSENLTFVVQRGLYNTQIWEFITLENNKDSTNYWKYTLFFLDKDNNILSSDKYGTTQYNDLKKLEIDHKIYQRKIQQEKNSKIIIIVTPLLFYLIILWLIFSQNRVKIYFIGLFFIYWITIVCLPYWLKILNFDFIILIHLAMSLVLYLFNQKYFQSNLKVNTIKILLYLYVLFIFLVLLSDLNHLDYNSTYIVVYPYINVIIWWILNVVLFSYILNNTQKKEL